MRSKGSRVKPPQVSKVIEAPQRAVWAALTDVSAMPTVLSTVSRFEVLTDGPFEVGTAWRETRRTFGKRATKTRHVTEVHEPVAYSVCVDADGIRFRSTFELVARSSDTTQVTVRCAARPLASASRWRRMKAALVGPVALKAAAKRLSVDLDDIARHAHH